MTGWSLAVEMNCDLLEAMGARVAELSAEVYAASNETVGSVGIGGHVRHCTDFYHAFLEGVGRARVDYDARSRRTELEEDPHAARLALEALPERLRELVPVDDLVVRLDAPDDDPEHWTPSSGARELRFLAAHTVHHAAMMAMLMRLAGEDVPSDFGIAPSTLRHWRDAQAKA